MRRLQKTSFAKFVRQNFRRKQFLIFTKQSIVAAPNAKMFSLMMRSIAPCAEQSKFMEERRFDYEDYEKKSCETCRCSFCRCSFCHCPFSSHFQLYGICRLFRRSELRKLRSLSLGQLLLRKLRPLYGGLQKRLF